MNLHPASFRPLVPCIAAWVLLLGGCSAIEIDNGQFQDRPFEPAQPASVVVENLPEPALDQTVDQPADVRPQEISDGLREPRVDSMAVDRILTDLNPNEGETPDLEARHAPAAGAVGSETFSADFFRRMNARAQVLHTLQMARREEAVDLPKPEVKGRDATGSESLVPTATAVLPPPDRGNTDQAILDGLEEPQFVASRVARLPAAAGPDSKAAPVSKDGLSVRIDFIDDQVESSPADQDRLDTLASRLRTDARPVRIRAFAGALNRQPSNARRLALKRLFAVRDQLLAKGVDKATLELDAGVLIDEGEKGDRVEIAVAAASPPVRQTTAVRRPTAERQKPTRGADKPVTAPPRSTRQGPALERPAPAVARSTERAVGGTQVVLVQVGSHKNRPDALAQADRLKSTFPSLLGSQEVRITTVDLAGRGDTTGLEPALLPTRGKPRPFAGRLRLRSGLPGGAQQGGSVCHATCSATVSVACRLVLSGVLG